MKIKFVVQTLLTRLLAFQEQLVARGLPSSSGGGYKEAPKGQRAT